MLWVKKGGGTSYDTGWAIAVDASGNSYVTGIFSGIATFGNITVTSSGDGDMFIVKHDASGNVLWVKTSGGIGDEVGKGIAIDAFGNLYVSGSFYESASFGSVTLTGSLSHLEMFIVKYDASGNVLWAKKGGGTNTVSAQGIAVDASGNSYVTGLFEGTANFSSSTITVSGTWDMYIAKYDASGNVLWAKKGGGTGTDAGQGIVVDAIGNSYVTGYFQNNANFGGVSLTGSGGAMFIAKYDTSGNLLWAKQNGGIGGVSGNGIALDVSGNFFVTGHFFTSATFGSIMLTSSGFEDLFIAKYNASGNVLWAKKGGGNGSERGKGIGVDASGNSFVTGTYQLSATFDNITFTNSGMHDIFNAKLSSVVSGLEEEAGKVSMQIYPNPFKSTFSITLPAPTAEPLLICITDVLGREVYRQTLATDAAGVVSVSPSKALTSGFYHLQVQTAKATFTKKLVVE